MPKVAYIANQFPSPVEPYVMEEIRELQGRGVRVVSCSVRRPDRELDSQLISFASTTLYLLPLRLDCAIQATILGWRRRSLLSPLLRAALGEGNQPVKRRLRALAHTWMGAYYAVLLKDREVEHIHAHHGYFASWIAMTAARLLGITFSLTLHGSDLLLQPSYLDTKLEHCKFCLTVSEFNRSHILQRYRTIDPDKILIRRMGAAPTQKEFAVAPRTGTRVVILSVGRLHAVKDHAFLIRACRRLKRAGTGFICLIAGEGPERVRLERLICDLELQNEVQLLGHVPRSRLDAFYAACDLVVLTSRSEGIPLALMEAMSYGRVVLAPDITGIPELVKDGETGFLYRPGSLADFVAKIQVIANLQTSSSGPLRRAARRHVLEHFNRDKNLARFGETFLALIDSTAESRPRENHENSVLQQVQL